VSTGLEVVEPRLEKGGSRRTFLAICGEGSILLGTEKADALEGSVHPPGGFVYCCWRVLEGWIHLLGLDGFLHDYRGHLHNGLYSKDIGMPMRLEVVVDLIGEVVCSEGVRHCADLRGIPLRLHDLIVNRSIDAIKVCFDGTSQERWIGRKGSRVGIAGLDKVMGSALAPLVPPSLWLQIWVRLMALWAVSFRRRVRWWYPS